MLTVVRFDVDKHLENGFREALGALSPTVAHFEAIARSDYIRKMSNCWTFVCIDTELADRVVGTISVVFEPKLSRQCRYVAHIEDVAVAPDQQGRGIGKFMVSYAEAFAISRGVRSIVLTCADERVGFYEELGFKNDGVAMRKLINE